MAVVMTQRPERKSVPRKPPGVKGRLRIWTASMYPTTHAGERRIAIVAGRGCLERQLAADGSQIADLQDKERRLVRNVGDKLIVASGIDGPLSLVEVVAVHAGDWRETWTCRVLEGSSVDELGCSTGNVHVMPGPKQETK